MRIPIQASHAAGKRRVVEASEKNCSRRDPDAVKADILRTATEAFAADGLSGSRIEEIAARTRTSKRMIYYYFGDKIGLYRRVLEEAYREMREAEGALALERLDPVAALKALVDFTFRHHSTSPEFIRLVMIENVHHGRHLRQSTLIRELNRSAIEKLSSICARGIEDRVFRDDIDPLELHWHISALCFFNVSNAPTFSASFGERPFTRPGQARLRAQVTSMILRLVLRPALIESLADDCVRSVGCEARRCRRPG